MHGRNTNAEDEATPFDIVAVSRGFVVGVVGVDDWDVSRMREAHEIVLYDFGRREAAQQSLERLRETVDLRQLDVDVHFAPGDEVVLGDGCPPSLCARGPVKYVVRAAHGFTHGVMETVDLAIEIIRLKEWSAHPGARKARLADAGTVTPSPSGDAVAVATPRPAAERRARLAATPRMRAEGPSDRDYTPPEFSVPVRGFYRPLPGRIGKDEDGNYVVPDKTWVISHKRHADKDDRPTA